MHGSSCTIPQFWRLLFCQCSLHFFVTLPHRPLLRAPASQHPFTTPPNLVVPSYYHYASCTLLPHTHARHPTLTLSSPSVTSTQRPRSSNLGLLLCSQCLVALSPLRATQWNKTWITKLVLALDPSWSSQHLSFPLVCKLEGGEGREEKGTRRRGRSVLTRETPLNQTPLVVRPRLWIYVTFSGSHLSYWAACSGSLKLFWEGKDQRKNDFTNLVSQKSPSPQARTFETYPPDLLH